MRRDTWFKCDPTDLIEGIESCEDETQGLVYVMVLMRIYQSGGPVANNPAAIGALCGRKGLSRTKTARVIGELLELGKLVETDDGRLFNRRAGTELGDRARLSETRSAAGKMGGRPSKNESKTDSNRTKKHSKVGEKSSQSENVSGQEIAENRQSQKPNASYARVREEEIREESSPTPPRGKGERDGQKPDEPLTAEQRAELARKVSGVADRPDADEDRVARLTGEIMRRAKITAPPIDLVMVERWIAMGAEDELILATVSRMAAGARGPIRQFRYFDAEIKRQHEAKSSADDAEIAYFRKVAARAQGP